MHVRKWAVDLYAILAIVGMIIFSLAVFAGFSDIRSPVHYQGDPLYYLFITKNVMTASWPYTASVGLPYESELILFPSATYVWILIKKILSLITRDLFIIENLFVYTVTIISGISFYVIARLLRIRVYLSIIGAVLFGLLPFSLSRAFPHQILLPLLAVSIGSYYALLVFYVPYRLFWTRKRPWLQVVKSWLPIVIGSILIGLSGHYWVGFGAYLIVMAGVMASLSSFSRRPFLLSIGICAIATSVFIVSQLPTFLAAHRINAAVPISARSPIDQALYGLKVPDLLVPIVTGIGSLDAKIQRYHQLRYPNGEGRDNFLGLFGVFGFVIGLCVFFSSFTYLFGRHRRKRIPMYRWRMVSAASLLSVVAILFGVSNGFGNVFHLFISRNLRAQNRISVYIAFFSFITVLLIAEGVLRKYRHSLKLRWAVGGVVSILALVSVHNQVSWYKVRPLQAQSTLEVAKDKAFFAAFQSRLGTGRRVLQLPIMVFPGSPPIHALGEYEHMKGYLFTTNIGWSYGAVQARPAIAWQHALMQRSTADWIARARAAGFDTILIERKGYEDNANSLIADITRTLSPGRQILDRDDRVVFDLCPSLDFEDRHIPLRVNIEGRGFGALEQDTKKRWRWNNTPEGTASIAVNNRNPGPRQLVMEGAILGGQDEFVITVEGPGFLKTYPMKNGAPIRVEVNVPPGYHLLTFSTTSRRVHAPQDTRTMHMALVNWYTIDVEYEKQVRAYLAKGNLPCPTPTLNQG
jgi:phosphoglycerol transferase